MTLQDLKEKIFGKWVCIDVRPFEVGDSVGLLMLFQNLKTKKKEARLESLAGYKRKVSVDFAEAYFEEFRK